MGEYPRGHHPASRAALVPFAKGHDPRRQHGAPSFGGQITAMMNELGRSDEEGNALYSEDELKEMVSDPRSSHARVIAAREILRARLEGFDRIDRVPKAANSIDRILDRTLGKPVQTLTIQHKQQRTRDEVLADISELLAREPGLRDLIQVRRPALEQPIETTAEPVATAGGEPQYDAEGLDAAGDQRSR